MLWTRICIMDLIRSIFQKFLGVLGYPLGVSWQLPNCPSNAHVFRDRTMPSFHFRSSLCSAQASSFLSSPFCYKPLLARKSLFSFVIRWKSSSSSSFFVFFNGPFSVIYFYFYFIFLIWSEKYILKVEFWSTKHQATLIYYKKKIQILHALFLLKIYLFSYRVLKKLCGYMLRNFFFYFVDALS